MKRHLTLFLAIAGFIGSLSAQSFFPDDPYFFPGDDFGAHPDYYGQWHLINLMEESAYNAGIDVRIAGAWERGLTGAGVTIAVIDDGVQGNHSDLQPSFQNAYSWSFELNQADNMGLAFRGMPVEPDDSHGTAVAGVAAARGGNNNGLTGAAPMAGIAGLRYLGAVDPEGRSDGAVEAAAILYQGQLDSGGNPDPFTPHDWSTVPVRVKNHSYGIGTSFVLSEGYELLIDALEESLSHGVLHVWAAGNARIEGGSDPTSTADSSKSLPSTIPGNIIVGALGSTGVYAEYSSYGASLFVTAPSGSSAGFDIATTDVTGNLGYNTDSTPDPLLSDRDYSSDFDGTSSASPLVAGIMALGVEANPDMDSRMARHLLALTSRIVDPDDNSATGGWVVNTAGYTFNNNYGFGLIDADAFTLAATQVIHLSTATVFEGPEVTVNLAFDSLTEGNVITQEFTVSVDPLINQPLEYVTIEILISGLQTDWEAYMDGPDGGSITGDFSAWLTSPGGTRNQLFYSDRELMDFDFFGDDSQIEARRDWNEEELEWIFLSNAYWGENIDGTWVLELFNETHNDLTGLWESFSFNAGMGSITLIPEPATVATLLGALVFLVVLRQRRRLKGDHRAASP